MSKATYPLKLPVSIKRAAERLAKQDGVSLNQWIAAAVAEKVGVMETAQKVLRHARRWRQRRRPAHDAPQRPGPRTGAGRPPATEPGDTITCRRS